MQSLSVRYRPQEFSEVCSQSSIVKILRRQLDCHMFKNAYLFCGASGCGKTTIARIFANEINHHVGVPIEIDGASNNGVDNVKQIIKSANERSIDSEYKIYIIDECHSLTNQAWQAFLKCIEEPPVFTIFIFCTTDPQKIPSTILNRVMRFNFNRINSEKIKERLEFICKAEGFTDYEESCDYISKICGGQMRDAIALLDKCASYDNSINIDNVLSALGNYSYDSFYQLVNHLIDGNSSQALSIIQSFYEDGADLKLFVDQFLSFCLDINKYCICKDIGVTKLPLNFESKLNSCINFDTALQYYSYLVDKLLALKNMVRYETDIKSTVEVTILQLCRYQ